MANQFAGASIPTGEHLNDSGAKFRSEMAGVSKSAGATTRLYTREFLAAEPNLSIEFREMRDKGMLIDKLIPGRIRVYAFSAGVHQ